MARGAVCLGMDITNPAANAAEHLIRIMEREGAGIQADARYIPVSNDSLDFVYSSGVLHHSPDINRSVSEIHRCLKRGGKAYIMLYAKWSHIFMGQRIKGILKGYWSKKKQQQYISHAGETAWRTESRKNPHTDTFSKKECEALFRDFKRVQIRKGSFTLTQLPVLAKFIPSSTLDDFSLRHLKFLDGLLGACLFIVAEK